MTSTTHETRPDGGFVTFFRAYTKTWIHAVATAGLTAFGTLTIVHNWFAALALASYIVPPVVLYLRSGTKIRKSASEPASEAETEPDSAPATGSEPAPESEAEAESGLESEPERDPGMESKPKPGTESKPEPEPDTESDSKPTAESASAESDRDTLEAPTADTRAETGDSSPTGGAASAVASGDEESSEPAATDDGTTENGGDETVTDPQEPPAETPEWHAVDVPTEATLHDVVVGSSGVYAVGDGGCVLAADADSTDESDADDGEDEEWTVVLEDGPAAGGNDLRGVDATADGDAVWVAGDSGSLGRIDAGTARHTDYTAPQDITDNWLGVAVGGESDDETILLINGSGAVLRGRYRDGDLEWSAPDKPGSGSSFSGVALADASVGYCCDTNDGVYETADGGDSFERVGLEGADGTLTDVATTGREDCLVSADDGVVHRYGGSTWTPERVTDGSLAGLDRDGERAVACGDAIHERSGPTADWERVDIDVSEPLHAVSAAPDRTVAVGENGTVLEFR